MLASVPYTSARTKIIGSTAKHKRDFTRVTYFYMPLLGTEVMQEEKVYPVIPADVYECVITDVESETKPSMFRNPDGSEQEPQTQFKFNLQLPNRGAF